MTIGGMLGVALLAALALGGLFLGRLFRKRPLEVWVWGARRALARAGLKKITMAAPAGPLTVFVGGTGPVLVLLHGAGDQAGTWARVAASLVKSHTLVIPDLAGHGASAPATGPISTAAIYAGLEAVIADQARGRRITLVGNSLGAWMAMVLAARHPDWVERVVAVNGGALKGSNDQVNLLPRTREEARQSMAQLRDAGSPALPDSVLDDLARRAGTGPLARFAATAASMEAWTLTEDQLHSLAMPVRLIWGASDQLMPLAYAERLEQALPDAQLVILERCGHVPQQEAPGRFLSALQRVLDESRSEK